MTCTCDPDAGGYICVPCLLEDARAKIQEAETALSEAKAETRAAVERGDECCGLTPRGEDGRPIDGVDPGDD